MPPPARCSRRPRARSSPCPPDQLERLKARYGMRRTPRTTAPVEPVSASSAATASRDATVDRAADGETPDRVAVPPGARPRRDHDRGARSPGDRARRGASPTTSPTRPPSPRRSPTPSGSSRIPNTAPARPSSRPGSGRPTAFGRRCRSPSGGLREGVAQGLAVGAPARVADRLLREPEREARWFAITTLQRTIGPRAGADVAAPAPRRRATPTTGSRSTRSPIRTARASSPSRTAGRSSSS